MSLPERGPDNGSLQSVLRSIPACFSGSEGALVLRTHAKYAREAVSGARTTIFGYASDNYNEKRVNQAAQECENYALMLEAGGYVSKHCTGSNERNQVITLLGNMYGHVAAVTGIDGALSKARSELATDIKTGFKVAGFSLVTVAILAVAAIIIIPRVLDAKLGK